MSRNVLKEQFEIQAVELIEVKALLVKEQAKRKQVEIALKETEEKFNAIVQATLDGILVIDSQSGQILDLDQATEHILNYQAEMFSNQHISSQAAGIENAYLHKKPWQQIDQLLTLNKIGHTINSTLDFQEGLTLIAKHLAQLLDAAAASIALYDEASDEVWFAAVSGQNADSIRGKWLSKHQGVVGWVIRHNEPLLVSDMSQDPRFNSEFEEASHFTTGSVICVPLYTKGQTIGAIEIINKENSYFSDKDLRLVNSVVAPVATTIENARLRAETEKRAWQLTTIHELDRAISASLRINDVYHAFARHTARLFTYHHMSIMLRDEDGLRVTYVTGKDPTTPAKGHKFSLKTSTIGRVTTQGQPLLRHNIARDARFAEDKQLTTIEIQSSMIIPLRSKGQIIGVWHAGSHQVGAYGPDDLEIAQSVADQLAIAIENAQLYNKAQQEIIERKWVEAELRSSEERFRHVIASISDHIYVTEVTKDGARINLYISPHVETLTGYSTEKFMDDWGFWSSTVIHPDDRAIAAIQAEHLVLGHDREIEYRLVRAGGEIVWVRDSARVEHDKAASQIIYGLVTDITERKQLEEQLRQSQKMEAVGRLAGGIAHDFNNLLTVIIGYSELLLHRQADAPPSGRQLIEEIKKAGERAGSLTRQLLAFSRKQVLQPKILDLNSVVIDVEKMLRRLISADIKLLTSLGKNLGSVKADPGQIEQVIVNLVVNAGDAMPRGGTLKIKTANVNLDEAHVRRRGDMEPGSYVMLSVSDTGIGMSSQTLSHIFEPFFTTKGQDKGTGLGLATVYGIVTQSGGYIEVDSKIEQGSTFRIYLPRVEETSGIDKPEQRSELPCGSETILLVEDEDSVRTLVREILIEQGYNVLEAQHGDEALGVNEQYDDSIHLLITDIVMPGRLNGWELSEQLLSLHPNLKILYISGYTDSAMIHQTKLDANALFLQKPFTRHVLARKVRELLDVSSPV